MNLRAKLRRLVHGGHAAEEVILFCPIEFQRLHAKPDLSPDILWAPPYNGHGWGQTFR